MKLYSYWRSSAAYRVRIALNLKGLDYEVVPVHLLKDGGEQLQAEYQSINPQGIVPALVTSASASHWPLSITWKNATRNRPCIPNRLRRGRLPGSFPWSSLAISTL